MSARAFIFALTVVSNAMVLAAGFATASTARAANTSVSADSLPNGTTVASYTYAQDNLVNDLTQQLTERYRVNGELQVDVLRAWTPLRPTSEPVSLVVLEAPGQLASTLLVRFRLQAGTQVLTETAILVRAQLMRDVWVARGPVDRNSAFDSALFDIRRVDTLRERDVVPTTDTTGELTFARSIPAGRLLSWRDITRRAMVRKGQVIEVCATDGALTITMKALAMESGAAGETVRIRNIESKKEFTAQVVSESRAEVRL